MSGVKLGGRESDLTIPECGLAIMLPLYVAVLYVYIYGAYTCGHIVRNYRNRRTQHENYTVTRHCELQFRV